MAEIDPEKVGRSGIDPITGSILSQEVRNSLLRKTTFDASVFRNDLLAVEARRKAVDLKNNNVIQEQESVLIGFNSNIQALRNDIGKLGTGLANIALLLQQDGTEEQSRIRVEQERQRILAERQIRIGKENDVEQKIQNAIVKPVQRLVPQVSDLFGNIKNALFILFSGWLTNQIVQGIKASEEGNIQLFEQIKFNIIKNLAMIGGGLLAIKVGFSLVKSTISRVASGLARLLIAKPLEIAGGLLRNVPGIGGGGKTPLTTGPKSGGGGGGMLGNIGKVITGVSGVMNFLNGEYVDAALTALTFVPGGGIFKGIRIAAGTIFTIDEIAEALGKNFTGADPRLLAQKKKELEEARGAKAPTSTTTKATPTTTPPPAAVTSQPQTPMMHEQKPIVATLPTGAFKKASEDQAQISPQPTKESVVPSEMIVTAQVTAPPKQAVKVGQLPEPNPSLTVIKTSNNTNQQQNVPATYGALTDVPLINSSNPDNFYVLYSQLTYNVVT
jgi:hypothetical protein